MDKKFNKNFINFNSIVLHKECKVNFLWMAVQKNRLDLVRFLVEECNARINIFFLSSCTTSSTLRRCSVLFWAVYLQNYRIARYLIEMGANVNIPNVVGTTPLMLSIRNEEFCRYL